MPRSVNSVAKSARTKKMLSRTKGYFGKRKNVRSHAKIGLEKGLLHAFVGRRNKKRDFRTLWIARINAAIRTYDMSYSEFMGKLKKNNIEINRKVLADLADNNPAGFKAIVDSVK